MHRLLLPIGTGLAGTLLIGSLSLAGAQGQGDETLVTVVKALRNKLIDVGNRAQSPGDVVLSKDAIWNAKKPIALGLVGSSVRLTSGRRPPPRA